MPASGRCSGKVGPLFWPEPQPPDRHLIDLSTALRKLEKLDPSSCTIVRVKHDHGLTWDTPSGSPARHRVALVKRGTNWAANWAYPRPVGGLAFSLIAPYLPASIKPNANARRLDPPASINCR